MSASTEHTRRAITRAPKEGAAAETAEDGVGLYNRVCAALMDVIQNKVCAAHSSYDMMSDITPYLAPNVSIAYRGTERSVILNGNPLPANSLTLKKKLEAAEGFVLSRLRQGAYKSSGIDSTDEAAGVLHEAFAEVKELLSEPSKKRSSAQR